MLCEILRPHSGSGEAERQISTSTVAAVTLVKGTGTSGSSFIFCPTYESIRLHDALLRTILTLGPPFLATSGADL